MSWARGIINGKRVGYAVEARCEHQGCKAAIDRGLSYKCGGEPGDGVDYCDGFFCAKHLVMTKHGQRCERCADLMEPKT